MCKQLQWVAVLLTATQALGAKLYTDPQQLVSKDYSFVIAGGGAAGCVLASRLTENPNVSVLVVEAGGDNRLVLDSIVPFLSSGLAKTAADWNYTTTPQPGLAGRDITFQRGHILGGSTSVNKMVYNRAANNFYDKWANFTEDAGWSWSSVEPYYLRSSRLVKPADGHDDSNQTIASAHGYGPVQVSVSGYPLPIGDLVINASKTLEGRFGFNQDINAGNALGFTDMQYSIGDSRRSSAATAYLDPLFSSGRNNLDVLINTHVTRLIQTNKSGKVPEFKAVEITATADSKRYTIKAEKEVILSTGVIGTPQILKLSGIGPESELTKLGIKTIVDLPDLGANLTDHPLVPLYFQTTQPNVVDALLRNTTVFNQYLNEWNETGQGPMVNSVAPTQAYLRLPEDSTILKGITDPSSGPNSGHIELIIGEGFLPITNVPQPSTGNYIFVIVVLVAPTSRGNVTLNSISPFDHPIINPNYLTTSFDKAAIVQGIRDTFTFLSAPTFKSLLGDPHTAAYGPLAGLTTDEELLTYTQQHASSINHPCGTAKMTSHMATWGVVDPDFKLKGISGVRVVDASVFPQIPAAHTTAPTYIISERAADIIKNEYRFRTN